MLHYVRTQGFALSVVYVSLHRISCSFQLVFVLSLCDAVAVFVRRGLLFRQKRQLHEPYAVKFLVERRSLERPSGLKIGRSHDLDALIWHEEEKRFVSI